jgi:ABC-type spermidine/putrescine transport system permease subunit I
MAARMHDMRMVFFERGLLNQPDTALLYGYMAIYLHTVHWWLPLLLMPNAAPLSDTCTQTIGRTKDLKEAEQRFVDGVTDLSGGYQLLLNH